jgi:hypothetical protein
LQVMTICVSATVGIFALCGPDKLARNDLDRKIASVTAPVPGKPSTNEPRQRMSVPPAAFGVNTTSAR